MRNTKIQVIAEVLAVFLFFGIVIRWMAFFMKDQGLHYMLINLFFIVFGIGVPFLMIWLTKTNVGFNKWRIGIYGGFLVYGIGIIQSLGFWSVDLLGFEFSSLPAMFIMIGFVIIMIIAAYFLLQNTDFNKKYKIKWQLIFFLSLYLIPPLVSWFNEKSVPNTIFWQFYFTFGVGFGEELLYRGYIQTRLNDKLGKQWKIGHLRFGPGLIIASVLFGLSHMYQLGSTNIGLHFAFAAIFAGLFFGIVREKAGLWASVSFHVLWSAIPQSIMMMHGVM